MSKFKIGDKVRCIQKSNVKGCNSSGHYGKVGDIYTVVKESSYPSIYLTGNGIREYGLIPQRFELVEETSVMSNNPAIEEYIKTVTVRKVRSKTTLKFEGSNAVQVMSAGSTVELRTVGHRREHIYLNASDLRILARQLIEIADVMDEQKD